ncbi:f-box skp2 [Fusarium sporotrichioides]|uniref:F-box skp2 n=1 Tax=Fusarium sporotrichioides TaxID=5514 RepID=A0A395SF40_FUSSP|nr:f-box skp2 [Fusarium sporotrichioides]
MEPTSDSQEDIEEIVRVCAYHRYEFDDLLVRTPDSKLQAPFLQRTFNTPVSSSLGTLDRLPKELMLMILRELDIASYLHFRAVNNRARDLATDTREYSRAVEHGLAGLKTLLRVQTAQLFTMSSFYQALISPSSLLLYMLGDRA